MAGTEMGLEIRPAMEQEDGAFDVQFDRGGVFSPAPSHPGNGLYTGLSV